MTTAPSWLLWQLADSAFPSGSFAHSGGLEAARQHGELRTGSELIDYLRTALAQLPHQSMPFARAAFIGDEDFAGVDRLCDSFLVNHVANRASRLQGRAFLASAEKCFGNAELKAFRSVVMGENLPGHLAPVFGAVLRRLSFTMESVQRLFVFIHLRGWISAAVRLNIVGPLEGQNIQHQLADAAEAAAGRFAEIPLEQAAQTAPLLDLWQATQDRLYSRLFQS